MGGEMKEKIARIIIAIGFTILFLAVYTLNASTQIVLSNSNNLSTEENTVDIDMLIFISPQYKDDLEIITAINSYISAVSNDIGWNVKIINIDQDSNNYQKIDQTIENYYDFYDIKACIMVGEDTDTALGGLNNYMKKPSVVPWFTTGGDESYDLSEQGIICQPYTIDICISLIYPTAALDYQTKKSQIIDAFNKFSVKRNNVNDDILVFESSDINYYSKEIYQSLENYQNLYYRQDPSDEEIKKSFDETYLMYLVHGHSNPSGTDVNAGEDGWFSADCLDKLDTPFFGADGCYVSGWWSDQPESDNLCSSIDCLWYGSKIFTSENIVVMALGLLSQNGFSYPVSFIENAIPGLFEGKTLSESMIGQTCLGENIIIGDPTFHFID